MKLPTGFRFATLPRLEYLDVRGGTKADLSELEGCDRLQALVVNQVRGLGDLGAISGLVGLRLLSLYGLAQVERLPDLSHLVRLERLEVGQMRHLTDWTGLPTPRGLREVLLHNRVQPDPAAVDELALHPTLESFDWVAPDVAARVQDPVRERFAGHARTRAARPEEWYAALHGR